MAIDEMELQKTTEIELESFTFFSLISGEGFIERLFDDRKLISRMRLFMTSCNENEYYRNFRSMTKMFNIESQNDHICMQIFFSLPKEMNEPKFTEKHLGPIQNNWIIVNAKEVVPDIEVFREYSKYRVLANYYKSESKQYINKAFEALQVWVDKVRRNPITVYTLQYPQGKKYDSFDMYFEEINERVKREYKYSPDNMDIAPELYTYYRLRDMVKIGYRGLSYEQYSNEIVKCDPDKVPSVVFAPFWDNDDNWYKPEYSEEVIVVLKKELDRYLEQHLKEEGKVKFEDLFTHLMHPPYGLLPNEIGTIIMGMLLRSWKDRNLIWSNGHQYSVINDDKMISMIGNGIFNKRTPHKIYIPDYIMVPNEDMMRIYNESSKIFFLPDEMLFSNEIRYYIRDNIEKIPYPLMALKYADVEDDIKKLCDLYLKYIRVSYDDSMETLSAVEDELKCFFASDSTLADRFKTSMTDEILRNGMKKLLSDNNLDIDKLPADIFDSLNNGHVEWKWMWDEDVVIDTIRRSYGN